MFEIKPSGFDPGYIDRPKTPRTRYGQLYQQAVIKFNLARNRAWFHKLKCSLLKISNYLVDLETLPSTQVSSRYYAGIQAVDLDQVRGTVSRFDAFDNRFNPLAEWLRDRWISVAIARLNYLHLSPIELIKVGNVFFVQDGHHRISVARALGETAMDAEVVVWEVMNTPPQE